MPVETFTLICKLSAKTNKENIVCAKVTNVYSYYENDDLFLCIYCMTSGRRNDYLCGK